MELNDLKKYFYKKNPTAYFRAVQHGIVTYESEEIKGRLYLFRIPVADMGEAMFNNEMPCKHLIRWLKLSPHDI